MVGPGDIITFRAPHVDTKERLGVVVARYGDGWQPGPPFSDHLDAARQRGPHPDGVLLVACADELFGVRDAELV